MNRLNLVVAVALSVHSGCSLCGDTLLSEVVSPDRTRIARLIERDCGATTTWTRIVTIRPRFTLGEWDKHRVFVATGRPRMELVWRAPDALEIIYSGGEVRKQKEHLDGVTITYQFRSNFP